MADSSETQTPDLIENSAGPDVKNPPEVSPHDRLVDLVAQATAAYAVKDYSPAAELYSQATELQAEINGEMAIENADLLYSYGKCLYFVAVRNSEVLGGNVAGARLGGKNAPAESRTSKKRKVNEEAAEAPAGVNGESSNNRQGVESAKPLSEIIAEGAADIVPASDLQPTKEEKLDNKPLFQFSGDDENWDDSGDEEAEDANADADEEEEDDFANAFEVLDLARVLLLRKLDQLQQSAPESSGKGKQVVSTDLAPEIRDVKERVADVHDLQAEISLEGEKYSNAVVDLRAALVLKQELYPAESSVLAECHYKLSLALEFSSTTQMHDSDGNPIGEAVIDQEMREEAAAQMEMAINSCKLRVAKEQKRLESMIQDGGGEKNRKDKDKISRDIEDVQDMVADMQQRLVDLRKPPVSVTAANRLDSEAVAGVLGQILGGSSKEEQKRILDEASAGAKDLTGLVKRKKPKLNGSSEVEATGRTANGSTSGKRKVEFGGDQGEPVTDVRTAKKARVDEEDS